MHCLGGVFEHHFVGAIPTCIFTGILAEYARICFCIVVFLISQAFLAYVLMPRAEDIRFLGVGSWAAFRRRLWASGSIDLMPPACAGFELWRRPSRQPCFPQLRLTTPAVSSAIAACAGDLCSRACKPKPELLTWGLRLILYYLWL